MLENWLIQQNHLAIFIILHPRIFTFFVNYHRLSLELRRKSNGWCLCRRISCCHWSTDSLSHLVFSLCFENLSNYIAGFPLPDQHIILEGFCREGVPVEIFFCLVQYAYFGWIGRNLLLSIFSNVSSFATLNRKSKVSYLSIYPKYFWMSARICPIRVSFSNSFWTLSLIRLYSFMTSS